MALCRVHGEVDPASDHPIDESANQTGAVDGFVAVAMSVTAELVELAHLAVEQDHRYLGPFLEMDLRTPTSLLDWRGGASWTARLHVEKIVAGLLPASTHPFTTRAAPPCGRAELSRVGDRSESLQQTAPPRR